MVRMHLRHYREGRNNGDRRRVDDRNRAVPTVGNHEGRTGDHAECESTGRSVRRLQLTSAGSTSWTNPTVVYLDSMSVTGIDAGPWNFDQSGTTYSSAAISAASKVMFCNFGDNPDSGSTVSWYSK